MNKFDEIIKQKVEQFEVPYNDAHWAEMEGKLNTIKYAKITKNIFGVVGAITILSVAGYFIYTNNSTTQTNTQVVVDDNTIKAKSVVEEFKNLKNNTNAIQKNNNENPIVDEEKSNQLIEPKTTQEVINTDKNSTENNNGFEEKTNPSIIENDGNNIILNADFIVFNNKVCFGEKVSFEAISKNLPVSYLWNFGDGTTSNKVNPTHVYNESGNYDVSLTLRNRKTGSEIKNIKNNAVIIMPQPKADFNYNEISLIHDNNKLTYPYTEFSITPAETSYSYVWNFGNGEKSTSQTPKTIYMKQGDFQVTLTVKNNYGCYASVSKNIANTQDFSLLAPNTFSPDGDGNNETFIPKALLGWEVQFEMSIMDKANKLIYKTTDKNEPWNGKINNTGVLLEAGIYFWQVITYDAEGIPHRFNGQIKIMR